MKIIPAILAYDIADYQAKLKLVMAMTSAVQIDVIDQSLAKMPTLSLADLEIPPGVKPIFHLMTANPLGDIKACLRHRPTRIIIGAESKFSLPKLLSTVPRRQLGLAINPETPVAKIKSYINKISEVLVMTVKPGASGRSFQPPVLTKIKEIKSLAPRLVVSVDGGINRQTINAVKEARADIAYVASGIFEQTDPVSAYRQLQEE
jgi:ribulose-phosphate 3-epimerase